MLLAFVQLARGRLVPGGPDAVVFGLAGLRHGLLEVWQLEVARSAAEIQNQLARDVRVVRTGHRIGVVIHLRLVLEMNHGGDGLMLAEHERPDVVLLDIRMPGLSGTEVLQQFHLRWPELPVIMISGLGNSELARRSLRRGAFDYVHKPFDWDCLHRCVAAALGRAITMAQPLLKPESA